MGKGGHLVWVLVLAVLAMYLGLKDNDDTVPGVGVRSCGAAWSGTTSMTCEAAVSMSMQGSIALGIVAALALVGLVGRLIRAEVTA